MADLDGCYYAVEPQVTEYRMYTRGGRTVWLRDLMLPVQGAAGLPGYIWGVMYDISSYKAPGGRGG